MPKSSRASALGTLLYRLQAPAELITRTPNSLCRGQGIRAAAETHGLDKNTVQAWWVRFGTRAPALWHDVARGRVQVDVVEMDETFSGSTLLSGKAADRCARRIIIFCCITTRPFSSTKVWF